MSDIETGLPFGLDAVFGMKSHFEGDDRFFASLTQQLAFFPLPAFQPAADISGGNLSHKIKSLQER